MIDQEQFFQAISTGKVEEVKDLTKRALEAGETPDKILQAGLIKAMDRIGLLFKNNEIYIPEVLIAARAMHAGLDVLRPILAKSATTSAAKVILGTVRGDLHDIGKNLVGMMLEGGGFEVIDLGIDVPPEKFLEAARDRKAQVIGMSALLTTTMLQMKTTIDLIKVAGLQKEIKTIIGGAPVTAEFAQKIGADGYAPDAASAVQVVKGLVSL